MSASRGLVVITCSETDPRIDPSRHLNLVTDTTFIIKTAGGRAEHAINSIYYADKSNKIDMIIIIQHTSTPFPSSTSHRATRLMLSIDCAWSPGDVEANLRADIQILTDSPYIRNGIRVLGHVLDITTGRLREVRHVASVPSTVVALQSPVMPLVWHSVRKTAS
ncbi:hypothetical protein J1614_010202 [Plenodomus biglobosus]|nr:hypothetical protein J1614_010202 [Plenodomus biglobosus]